MAKLKEGDKAPDFRLQGSDKREHHLKDYLGRKVVLFFYPKDMTPGCTTESCTFSDNLSQFKKYNAEVLGISKDSLESHDQFIEKHQLKMPLLSDPDIKVHEAYGAFGSKLLYGKTALGVIRSTFLIDEHGKIAKVWYNVKVDSHIPSVLQQLEKIS